MKKFKSNYKIAILGNGGHASVCLDILKIHKKEPFCYITLTKEKNNSITSSLQISDEEFIHKFRPDEIQLINGVGIVPGENFNLRKKLYCKYTELGYEFLNLIHPSTIISESVRIKDSVQIMAGCIIQNNVTIEENSIINTGSIIEHDCFIGNSCHIAPGSILCGSVKVDSNVFLPAGSIIKQNTVINKEKNYND